jgi:cytidine deaminase
MSDLTLKKLIDSAKSAKTRARALYSNFPVGAALETVQGDIFTGCNVESSSYGLTICAERVALVKALSEGETDFRSITIVGPYNDYCPPCGACRQLLYDYAPGLVVNMTDGLTIKTVGLKDLLPLAFEKSKLKQK